LLHSYSFSRFRKLNEAEGYSFKATLIASLATTAPVVLDYILDYIFYIDDGSCVQTVPKHLLFFIVFLPDLVIVAVILPLEKYSLLPAVICFRDALYTFGWLTHMNQLCPEIWSLPWITTIASFFSFSNTFTAFNTFSGNHDDDWENWNTPINFQSILLLMCVIIGLTLYVVRFFHWSRYYYSLDSDGRHRLFPCNLYTILFLVYIIVDWSYSNLWGFLFASVAYLSLYTCVMTFCTLVAVVMTVRIARMEAVACKCALLEAKKMYIRYTAHEIRTPLNVVFVGLKVLTRLLENGAHRCDCLQTIQEIVLSSSEAVNILNDILLYDKIENSTLTLETEDLEICELIENTTAPFKLQVHLLFKQYLLW